MANNTRQSLQQKYAAKSTTPSTQNNGGPQITVKSSPFQADPVKADPKKSVRQNLLSKYGSGKPTANTGPSISVNTPQNNNVTITPARTAPTQTITPSRTNQSAGTTVTVDRATAPSTAPSGEFVPDTFANSVRKFFGLEPKTKTGMVFPLSDDVAKKVVFKAQQQNQSLREFQRKVSTGLNEEDYNKQFNTGTKATPYDYDRLGNMFIMRGINQILPTSLIRAAAPKGSIADDFVLGKLDPENMSEQIASYSGTTLGSVALFEGAAAGMARTLGKVPAYVNLAAKFPKIATSIASGLTFALTNTYSDVKEGQLPTKRELAGDFTTGAIGFGRVGEGSALRTAGAAFGGTLAGEKLKGSSNTEALTSSLINTLFRGYEEFGKMPTGTPGSGTGDDVIINNAFKELNLPRTASEKDIKTQYRKLAHEYHPDKVAATSGEAAASESAKKFNNVNASYKIALEAKSPTAPVQTGTDPAAPAKDESFLGELKTLYTDIMRGDNIFSGPSPVPSSGATVPGTPDSAVPTENNAPNAQNSPATAPQSKEVQTFTEAQKELLVKPTSAAVQERIRELASQNVPAFGREVRNIVTTALGHSTGDGSEIKPKKGLEDLSFNTNRSVDGRPAQFNMHGEIEIFLPNLMEDIEALSTGAQLQLHEGPDTVIFQKKPDESFTELATRYTREVVMHEAGHKATQTPEDSKKLTSLMSDRMEAIAAGDAKKTDSINNSIRTLSSALERQANAYVRENRAGLETKYGKTINVNPSQQRAIQATESFNKVMDQLPQAAQDKVTAVEMEKMMVEGRTEGLQFSDAGMESSYPLFKKIYQSMKVKPVDEQQFQQLIKNSKSRTIDAYRGAAKNILVSETKELTENEVLDMFIGRIEAEAEIKQAHKTLNEKSKDAAFQEKEKATMLKEVGKKIENRLANAIKANKIVMQRRSAVEKARGIEISKYESILKRIQDKTSSVKQIQDELIEYAKTFLPLDGRGDFLNRLVKVRTREQATKIFAAMDKKADLINRKRLINEITGEIKTTKVATYKKFPKAKFEKSSQEKLDFIRENLRGPMKGETNSAGEPLSIREWAQNEVFRIVSEFRSLSEQNASSALPVELVSRIELLKSIGIDEMTAEQLGATLQRVQEIKEDGRTALEIAQFNKETERLRDADLALFTMTQGEDRPSLSQALWQEQKKNLAARIFDKLNNHISGWHDLMDILSKHDVGSKPYESFLSILGKEATRAIERQNEGTDLMTDIVGEGIQKIYGLEKRKDINKMLLEMDKVQEVNNITGHNGRPLDLKITRGQAIQAVMLKSDVANDESFSLGMNWGEDVWQQIDYLLSDKDMEVADFLLNFYRDYYKRISATFEKENGIALPFNDNYSPAPRDVDAMIPENVMLAKETGNYASVKNGSLKERVKNAAPLKLGGAFQVVDRHIAKMEHYIAWTETMSRYRSLFGNKEVRLTIRDYFGQDMVNVIDRFLNDFARDGVMRELTSDWMDKVRNHITTSTLGINLNVAKSQLTGVLNYAIEIPIDKFLTGTASYYLNPIENATFLYENSPMIRERVGKGFERDVKFSLGKGYAKNFSKKKGLSEANFYLIRTADKLTLYPGFFATYKFKLGELKNSHPEYDNQQKHEAAIRYAEEVVGRTQESSDIDTLGQIQRGGSALKLFTMYQTQPNKYARMIFAAARNYRAGRGDKRQHIKTIILLWFVIPWLYQLIKDKGDFKKANQLPQFLLGPLGDIAGIGPILQTMVGWMFGNPYDVSWSPVFSPPGDVKRAIDDIFINNPDHDPSKMLRGITRAIDASGAALGVPTKVVTTPVRNAIKEANGTADTSSTDAEPTTPIVSGGLTNEQYQAQFNSQ